MTTEDSRIVSILESLPKSAKSKKPQEDYVLHEVANLVRSLDIKLVGAWGFEPQTPTVSTRGPTPRITRNRFLWRKI
jgi:hypothetical protein